jgi:hypothetical protein
MATKRYLSEGNLAALAKHWRVKSGKRKVKVAAELGVRAPTVHLAEENPEQSLTRLRIRMIEQYSPYKVIGPVYLLKRK